MIKAVEKIFPDKKKRFSEVFESTFHMLSEVHNTHVKTLRECIALTPVFESVNGKLSAWYLIDGEVVPFAELPEKLNQVKKHWSTAREESGGAREQVRRKSQAILNAITSPDERRFMVSVFTYFMYPGKRTQSEPAIDSTIKDLLARGPDAVFPSTALTVQEELQGLTDADEIRSVLTKAKEDAYRRWSEVGYYYHVIWAKALRV